MKKFLIFLMTFLIFSSISVSAEMQFSDTEGHWAEKIIEKWKDSGYVNGYPDGYFKPDDPVTRAELSKILAVAFELTESESINYDDVSNEDWYYSYLQRTSKYIPKYALPTLYEQNIPYSENESKNVFLPNVNAIRMHVAEALVEIKLEREDITVEDETIQEVNKQVQEVFKDAEYSSLMAVPRTGIPQNVQRMNRYTWLAYKLNIMEGDEERNFNPYGYMTRAEIITAVDRMMSNETSKK